MAKVKIVVDELDKEICHLYGRFDKRGFLYLERLGGDKEPERQHTKRAVCEGGGIMNAEREYRLLALVLNDALNQAQSGKGKERHACGEPFEQQEICQNTRAVGLGYPLGQARKKAREAKRLFETKGKEAAIAECLGAINYLAAAVIVMDEQDETSIADGFGNTFPRWCPDCGAEMEIVRPGKVQCSNACDGRETRFNWLRYAAEEPERNCKLNDCAYRPNNCTPSDMPE